MSFKTLFKDFSADCSVVPTGETSTVPAMLLQTANGDEFAVTETGEIFTFEYTSADDEPVFKATGFKIKKA